MDNPDVVMFGLMSSMRTGNMLLDMCICLMLPVFFERLWAFLREAGRVVRVRLDRVFRPQYRRTIIHKLSSRPYSEGKTEHKNAILQNAIRNYVGRCLEAKYHDGEVKLTAIPNPKREDDDSDDDSDDSSCWEYGPKGASIVEQLEKKYHPMTLPLKNETVEVLPGLYFRDEEQTDEQKDEQGKHTGLAWTTKQITLSASRRGGGKQKVDKFVDDAYKWYMDEVEKNEEKGRFMYQPLVQKLSLNDTATKPQLFKKYRLGQEKTFKSLFFPEKEKLRKLLTQFCDRTDKFAVKGIPYRLGLLLHGPPGTGKTSLVKAIACETARHIVSIQLSRVRTNQELMDIMFDLKFRIEKGGGGGGGDDSDDEGGESTIAARHKFEEVVFLLEDIDAASRIVENREEPDAEKRMKEYLAQKQKMDGKKKTDDSPLAGFDLCESLDKDRLNLAGLLNVLDGVVDAPGRILVMTTNHRERLDTALLRPGRVNLQLYMGYLQPKAAAEMAAHYYPASTPEQVAAFKAVFERRFIVENFLMSPAELEQLCAENNTVEELISSVVEYGNMP